MQEREQHCWQQEMHTMQQPGLSAPYLPWRRMRPHTSTAYGGGEFHVDMSATTTVALPTRRERLHRTPGDAASNYCLTNTYRQAACTYVDGPFALHIP
jgi:hypothetical protein